MCQDARAAKTYRDELDGLRPERAERVDKLEAELLRYIGDIVILTVVDQVQVPRGGAEGGQGDTGGGAGGQQEEVRNMRPSSGS